MRSLVNFRLSANNSALAELIGEKSIGGYLKENQVLQWVFRNQFFSGRKHSIPKKLLNSPSPTTQFSFNIHTLVDVIGGILSVVDIRGKNRYYNWSLDTIVLVWKYTEGKFQ